MGGKKIVNAIIYKENSLIVTLQVGKWKGEQIYKTLDRNDFNDPILCEYYVHAPYMDFWKKAHEAQIQV